MTNDAMSWKPMLSSASEAATRFNYRPLRRQFKGLLTVNAVKKVQSSTIDIIETSVRYDLNCAIGVWAMKVTSYEAFQREREKHQSCYSHNVLLLSD